MGRYKHRALKWAWIDYFKSYIEVPDFESSGLYGLSKNSHVRKWDEETIIEFVPEKIKNFGWYYEIRDVTTSQRIAFIGVSDGRSNGFMVRNSFLEVSGIGLELRGWPSWFVDFAESMGFRIKGFARVDVTFDMETDTDWVCRKIFMAKIDQNLELSNGKIVHDKEGKSYTPIVSKGKVETLYIWKKKDASNTYQLLRVYNKKADCRAKGKEWLYERYEGSEDVTRFEIEIRRDKAQFWTVKKLLDPDYVFSVVAKTWFGYNRQFFAFLHQEDFVRIVEENTLYQHRLETIKQRKEHFDRFGSDFYSEKEEKQCLSTFVAYAKRLKKNGYTREKINEILEINDVF